MAQAEFSGTLMFEPAGAGTRLQWSWDGPVLAPAFRALGEQLNNPASAGSAGSSAGHKLTERVLNFFDYSRRAR